MQSIFMVSPDYLDVSYKEALKYDFTLQGYGSFELACRGLMKTNIADILGFVFLAGHMPIDTESFKEFLYQCNLVEGNKKFLIALVDATGLNRIDFSKYPNLQFSLVKIEEVVTDTVINRDVFGSVLLYNFKPYKFKEDTKELPNVQQVYRLQYKPLFSSYILKCLSKVHVRSTLEDTLQRDEVLFRYKKDKSDLALFREHYIRTHFEADLDVSYLLDLIQREKSGTVYGVYRALVSLIDAKHIVEGGDS